ncbi:HAD family hydrolase [Leptospira fluminis]|uniref:HAD family hydrolase n=1 Tax=Leptospira fluminis TaxID=2484979 RepID=UPI00143C72FB|nr:HAD hydrolase-like protein [Leptospira fluminis]
MIFWDFDGVIKESVGIKTAAYLGLFSGADEALIRRIRLHHEEHGGVSRFEKIPLYLEWAGIKPDADTVTEYCDLFSKTVLQAVIDSPWVPGAKEYISANSGRQRFFLVTATPQEEIEEILSNLDIESYFENVFGAPKKKTDAIRETLESREILKSDACMIGDSETDYTAAKGNGITFILRKTAENAKLQKFCEGETLSDFLNE